jgi:hypothetical protein
VALIVGNGVVTREPNATIVLIIIMRDVFEMELIRGGILGRIGIIYFPFWCPVIISPIVEELSAIYLG